MTLRRFDLKFYFYRVVPRNEFYDGEHDNDNDHDDEEKTSGLLVVV